MSADTQPAADLREAARAAYRESVGSGQPLSGKRLGDMFDRSERWGRDRVAECRNGNRTGTPTGNVTPLHTAGTGKPATETGGKAAAAGRRPRRQPITPAIRAVTTASVILVAVVAAAASYTHMRTLAQATGQGSMSWLLPLGVDGLMVAGSMVLLVRRRQAQPGGLLAWSAVIAGVAASLAANIAAAEPTLVARAVSAWPPVALLLAYELLLETVRPDQPRKR